MNIYLLRHGIAEEHDAPGVTRDADRKLTAKGERRTVRAADAIQAMDLRFDVILTSPLKRARQTAEIIAAGLDCKKNLELTELLAPGANARRLIEHINLHHGHSTDVLLVGHEPYLSELIAHLVFGTISATVTMRKGALCKLQTMGTLKLARCATLEWLLTPRQMCLMA